MTTNLLSIIIPVYNVEKYIRKCVQSLLSQDANPQYYEIIFIIDGSTDQSESIIRQNIENISYLTNIKILTKENGGLSSARNLGIQHAKGKYIWFVDSDDWIEPDSISYLLSIINKYDNIEVIAQTHYFQEHNKTRHIIRYNKEGLIKGAIFCGKNHSTAAQFYIVKKSFWEANHFQFRLGIFHEDGELTPRLLYNANTIYVITKPIYHILVREGSITHTINPKRCYDYMIVLDTLLRFYNKNVETLYKQSFSRLMSDHIIGIMNLSLQLNTNIQKDVNNYLTRNKTFIEILIKSKRFSFVFMGILLKIFPQHPLVIYKILKSLKRWK